MTTKTANHILRALYARYGNISPHLTLDLWLSLTAPERLCLTVARLTAHSHTKTLDLWLASPPEIQTVMIDCLNLLPPAGVSIASLLTEAAALTCPSDNPSPMFTPGMITSFSDQVTHNIEQLIPSLWDCLELTVQDVATEPDA